MPPKRKAAEPKAEPAAKRQTRSTAVSTSTSTPAAPSTTKAPAKSKVKAKAAPIELSSGGEEEVHVVEPKKKKAAPKAKKEGVAAPPKKKDVPAKQAPAAKKAPAAPTPVVSEVPPASTSTTPIPDAVKQPKVKKIAKAVSLKKPVSWEQGLKDWFAEYEEADEPGKMGGEGIETLFEEMGVSMEGVLPFLLAWKVKSKPGTFGSYFLSDFFTAFREPKVYSNSTLKAFLTSTGKVLYPSPPTPANKQASLHDFREFYRFIFTFVKEEGQKSLGGETAIALWGIILVPKYTIAKEFVEYATSLGSSFKGVSSDVWIQLLEFSHTVGDDLLGYKEEDAWPSMLDSFVEWRAEQKAAKA